MVKRRFAVLALLVIVAISAAGTEPPVLRRTKDPSAVDPGDGLEVTFNPRRDRAPEIAAERVLSQLRKGNCEQTLAFLDAAYRSDRCDREAKYQVLTWRLRDRVDNAEEVRLFFSVYRTPLLTAYISSNTWITVRNVHGKWVPVDFEAWY